MRASAASCGSRARGVDRARDAHRQRGRGFRLQREVGEHVAHQRLLDQALAEGLAVARMVQRLHQRLAHQRGRADQAVEPGQRHHLEDGGDAAPFLADQPGARALRTRPRRLALLQSPSLSFRRWMRTPLSVAIGRERGSRKQLRPPSRLRQHQVGIAHRRREEPLVADQLVAAVGLARRARVVFARTSEPPCFSVMPMPIVLPAFCAAGTLRGSYASAPTRGSQARGERRRLAQRRHARRRSSSAGSRCPGRPGSAGTAAPRARHGRRVARRGARRRRARRAACRAASGGGRPDGTRPRRGAGRRGRTALRRGRFSFAAKPSAIISPPATAPNAVRSASAQAAPSRATASRSAVSVPYRSIGSRAGTWLSTWWVRKRSATVMALSAARLCRPRHDSGTLCRLARSCRCPSTKTLPPV